MKTKLNIAASVAATMCALGMAGWTPAAHACNYEPYMGSICTMAVSPTRFQNLGNTYMLALGQTIAINQNTALFSLLGTTFGGDGTTTFKLPDLRGRVIVGYDPNNPSTGNMGVTGGSATIRLTVAQLPPHSVTFANAAVDISGVTASTMLSGLSATANLAGVRISGPASGLVIRAANAGGSSNPEGMYLGKPASATAAMYSSATPSATLNAGSIGGNLALTVDQGVTAPVTVYGTASTTIGGTARVNGASSIVGGGADVPVMPPYLVLPYFIAVQGIYPSSN